MDPFTGLLPFVHVAEEKSFRRAASRLGVTTAAVSKAVARLEASLGVALLERTSRSVSLTAEGTAYLARCREALDAMRAARDVVAQSRETVSGRLKVSASPIVARPLVRDLGRLLSRHPRLSVELSVTDRLARVVEEDIDVAIRIGPLEGSSLVAREVYAPRWVTVASPVYLGRRGLPRAVGDLASHDRLVFVLPSGKPRAWAFTEGQVDAAATLLVDQGDLLVEGALAGLGVAQVLDFMVREQLRDGRLVEVLPDVAPKGPRISAVSTHRRLRTSKVRAFVSLLPALFAGTHDVR